MKFAEWRDELPPPSMLFSRLTAAAAIIGLGLAASGCAQSLSEFARNGDGAMATAYPASAAPTTLAPTDPGTVATVTRPAVLVDEKTVPAGPPRTEAPMSIAPPESAVAVVPPDEGIAPAAANLNEVPEQPKSKLLTPDEKAKVIAELEALAKQQSATLGKTKKSADCAADKLDPAHRLASATGDGGC